MMTADMEIKDILRDIAFRGEVLFDEPMKKHTTLRIGGNADLFAAPEDIASLKNLLEAAADRHTPVTIVGGGSNLLVMDKGIEGLVVTTAMFKNSEIMEETGDLIRLFYEAGTPLQRLINISRERGYKGIEGLAGIPGTLGGAIFGNAGSFGYETGDVVEAVTVMNKDRIISPIKKDALDFGYRTSAIPYGTIILSAEIMLKKDDADDVAKRISGFHQEKAVRQPIKEWSAGSVFKNPEGNYAGKLIEEAGCKGMRRGDIEVSSLHANFFINKGNGRASDFLALADEVREKVLGSYGIGLELEIHVVGKDKERC